MGKLTSLEMLRAVAALLVLMFHVQEVILYRTGFLPFGGIFAQGGRGVDLFFVLSGFIIAHVHAADIGRPARLSNYLFNRAARIFPAVWIMSCFALLLYGAGFGGADKADKLGAWSIVASFLLLPQAGDALVNVSWTLKYEAFFYLVFGVMILHRKLGLLLLAAWQIGTLAAWALLPAESLSLGGYYFRSICLEFSVGLACAWLVARAPRDGTGRLASGATPWLITVLGVALFLGAMPLESRTEAAGILSALGAGALILGMVLLERAGRLRAPWLLVRLGGASYAIYLVHFSAVTLLVVLLPRLNISPASTAAALGIAAIATLIGLGFDQLLDQPIQRWLRRRVKPALGLAPAPRGATAQPGLAPAQPPLRP